MGHEYTDALLSKDGGVATLTLSRPEKLNAFGPTMEDDIRAALDEVRHDASVRALVVTGAGRAFSAGADVKAWDARLQSGQEETLTDRWQRNEARHQMPIGLHELSKPVIAAVNGPAVGMGMDIALACDIRLAAESARFGMLYIKRGLVPDVGGAWFLPRIVGLPRAYEIIFTGDWISGPEAERIGLANRCVPDDRLMDVTQELAQKIAAGPPIAMELAKRALRESENVSLRTHFDAIGYYMSLVNASEDVAEGMRAFVERRAPVFKGR